MEQSAILFEVMNVADLTLLSAVVAGSAAACSGGVVDITKLGDGGTAQQPEPSGCTGSEHWSQLSSPGLAPVAFSGGVSASIPPWFLIVDMAGHGRSMSPVGVRYDVASDHWASLVGVGAVGQRANPLGVAALDRFVVWGGKKGSIELQDGVALDVATDVWTKVSTPSFSLTSYDTAPVTVREGTWASAGDRIFVWGGVPDRTNAGVLDVTHNTWAQLSDRGAPTPRRWHHVVWTGEELIVWGGRLSMTGVSPELTNDGGVYRPDTAQWRPTTLNGAPEPRSHHAAVWTGSEVIVWGGLSSTNGSAIARTSNGYLYDPVRDRWTPMSNVDAPAPREAPFKLWTGDRFFVIGGELDGPRTSGGLYDPVTDSWMVIDQSLAPNDFSPNQIAWDGCRVLIAGIREPSSNTYRPEFWAYEPPR